MLIVWKFLQGELDDHEKLVWTLEQVDVVISTLAVPQHLEQLKIIKAMKDAGTIKVNIIFVVYVHVYVIVYVTL